MPSDLRRKIGGSISGNTCDLALGRQYSVNKRNRSQCCRLETSSPLPSFSSTLHPLDADRFDIRHPDFFEFQVEGKQEFAFYPYRTFPILLSLL
ncbi:hypothetical protein KQX54_005534 [Cotesia glomerata]|uniref:Uncharacterized protein n=1 Tax=Cotesia glomerata TaxID=32391 RepID=A0AAV7HW83_COTGL|nr:hypothetical protein KQX54_005534 [Cotesia glomerata]